MTDIIDKRATERAMATSKEKIMGDDDTAMPILAGTGPIQMTEDEWDLLYGGTINQSPLHLPPDQRAEIIEGFIWSQCEDEEGRDWLINGSITSNTAEAAMGEPLGFNVLGYWLSAKPWDTEKHDAGDIHASWGSPPGRDEDDEADAV